MSANTKLVTNRIRLRCMEDRDQASLFELFNDPDVMKYYSGLKNKRQTREWINWNKRNEKGYGVSLWIAEDKRTGDFLGQCGIVPQQVENQTVMEIGYMFARRHWGNGYAHEAARACLDYGFNERLFGKMTALIDPDNKASIRVAEKIGMLYDRTIIKWNKRIAVYERKSYN
ncbi:GNAT family N-acetyltransferase [Bacillus tequilensis]|uniref:GNAT family N-acetyltransferase n=1 Tax=Bacillus tequilensis TaxID=227866 RepID=A0A6H0WG60_9BACI|nr:GNAT family N-acetyltransferase [Bacillus tequilensis]NTU27959.1 GNAT family N-acetyltransferase [Bacillus tequilensis]QIW79531.1 GNAT family N-acetyltransferase [Bacillus tequilensis]